MGEKTAPSKVLTSWSGSRDVSRTVFTWRSGRNPQNASDVPSESQSAVSNTFLKTAWHLAWHLCSLSFPLVWCEMILLAEEKTQQLCTYVIIVMGPYSKQVGILFPIFQIKLLIGKSSIILPPSFPKPSSQQAICKQRPPKLCQYEQIKWAILWG